jgi:heme exporter protein D
VTVAASLGPYTAFILTAYAAAIVIVAGLIAWIMLDRRHLIRLIAEIEAQGVTRRSERPREEKP